MNQGIKSKMKKKTGQTTFPKVSKKKEVLFFKVIASEIYTHK